MANEAGVFLSQGGLRGLLQDTSMEQLLTACRSLRVTGTIHVVSSGMSGQVKLHGGFIQSATLESVEENALHRMCLLRNGAYTIRHTLPSVEILARAQKILDRSPTTKRALRELVVHCREDDLSCIITIISGFDRGEIHLHGGGIVSASLNGASDHSSLRSLVSLPNASYRVAPAALPARVSGAKVIKDPTVPFALPLMRHTRSAKGTVPLAPSAKVAIGSPPTTRAKNASVDRNVDDTMGALNIKPDDEVSGVVTTATSSSSRTPKRRLLRGMAFSTLVLSPALWFALAYAPEPVPTQGLWPAAAPPAAVESSPVDSESLAGRTNWPSLTPPMELPEPGAMPPPAFAVDSAPEPPLTSESVSLTAKAVALESVALPGATPANTKEIPLTADQARVERKAAKRRARKRRSARKRRKARALKRKDVAY